MITDHVTLSPNKTSVTNTASALTETCGQERVFFLGFCGVYML